MARRKQQQPVFSVRFVFPPPAADDETRLISILKKLIELGRPVVEREDRLICEPRAALDADDTARAVAIGRELCGK